MAQLRMNAARGWIAMALASAAALAVNLLAAGNLIGAAPAHAQATYPTPASNVRVAGVVPLQCNAGGTACAPVTAANPQVVAAVGDSLGGATDSGTGPVKIGGMFVTTSPTYTSGQRGELQQDLRGNIYTTLRSSGTVTAINSATVGDGAAGVNALSVNGFGLAFNGASWDRIKKPNTVSRLLAAAATTNSTLVKASAGDLFKLIGFNAKVTAVYLKLYNKATAPTCGTDTPVATFYVAPNAPFTIPFEVPLYFATGIGYCITGAAADADVTALAAADVTAFNAIFQ